MVMVEEHINDSVAEELRGIQGFLETETSEDPNELIERLGMLNVYMARTGYLLAVAKADQDTATARVFDEFSGDILAMPATIGARFIASRCREENYYVNWIERINRACVHQGDNIRTQVSFAKENMRLINTPYGNR